MNGITVAGTVIADVRYSIDHYPDIGMLSLISHSKADIGGTGNLLIALTKLDGQLPLLANGIIGNDVYGSVVLDALKQYPNIDSRGIVRCDQGETSFTLVMESQKDHQRTFFYRGGLGDRFDLEHICYAPNKIFVLEYLVLMETLDGYDQEFGTKSARVLKNAKDQGMLTAVDVVSASDFEKYQKMVIPPLAYTDFCVLNEVEAQGVTAIDLTNFDKNAPKALEKLRDYGVSKWVVIHTPKLCFGLDCVTGEMVKMYPKILENHKIVGRTGAGDCYNAGILYGAYRDFSLEESMVLANATASNLLLSPQGTAGINPYEKVIEDYENL